jgi:hypothetical protein
MSKTPEQEFINGVIRADTGAWFETYGKIWAKDRTKGLCTPKMNYLQKKIHRTIVEFEERGLPVRIVELKPRARGSTTFCVAEGYALMRRSSTSAVFIGGQSDQTVGLWNMMKTYKENDHFDWGNTGEVNEKGAHFTNGSRAKKETAKDVQAGIGDTYQLLHATEAARWAKYGVSNASEVMANILKAVPLLPKTYVFLESTAEGQCYDDQTEILTDQGWKLFKDLTGKEGILTKNPETHLAYYQHEWKFQAHRYEGPMIQFKTRTTNLKVTPNHRMWMARQKGPFRFTRADSVVGKTTDYRFQRSFIWDKPGLTHITIPAYGHNQGNGYWLHPEVQIPIDDWLRFLGHWLSDGHVDYRYGSKRVVTTQVKFVKEFRESAQKIANTLGAALIEKAHGNGRRFSIHNAQLACYLKDYARPKRIPRELLMGLSAKQCKDLILSIYEGDGLQERRNNYKIDRGTVCVGIDKEFQDDLQELSLKAGYASSVFGPERNRKVTFTSSTVAMVRHNNPPSVIEGYSGMTYCVTLPKDHLLMVRRGGIATWCGNSGDFYHRWVDAVDSEDFLNGKEISPGDYVRVFAPWFEFNDSALRLTAEQKRDIERTIDAEEEFHGEKELMDLYGVTGDDGVMRLGTTVDEYDVWEQLAWRRYAIRKECGRDKNIFDRDYPHSWRSAFQKSGNLRFNGTGLAMLRKRLSERVPQFGNFEETKDKRVIFRKTDPIVSKFTIFEMPIRGQRYLLAIDPMTGASQTTGADPDYHGVFVLRQGYWDGKGAWVRPATVARVVPCRWDVGVLEEAVWQLARFYGNRSGCKIVVEVNMDRGIIELLKQRSADLYRREIFNRVEEKTSKAYGFLTNEKTRENLIEKLSMAIRSWDEPGGGIDVFCPRAVEQCENFIVKTNGRSEAAAGFHDDDVLSIALGLEVLDHATMYVPPQPLPGWGEPPLRGQSQADPSQSVAFT